MNYGESPYPEVVALMAIVAPEHETVPPAERCAQNGWRPHVIYQGVCIGCCRTEEEIQLALDSGSDS